MAQRQAHEVLIVDTGTTRQSGSRRGGDRPHRPGRRAGRNDSEMDGPAAVGPPRPATHSNSAALRVHGTWRLGAQRGRDGPQWRPATHVAPAGASQSPPPFRGRNCSGYRRRARRLARRQVPPAVPGPHGRALRRGPRTRWNTIRWKERERRIPATRMKAGTEHRVPPSGVAPALLQRTRALDDGPGLASPSRSRQAHVRNDAHEISSGNRVGSHRIGPRIPLKRPQLDLRMHICPALCDGAELGLRRRQETLNRRMRARTPSSCAASCWRTGRHALRTPTAPRHQPSRAEDRT